MFSDVNVMCVGGANFPS